MALLSLLSLVLLAAAAAVVVLLVQRLGGRGHAAAAPPSVTWSWLLAYYYAQRGRSSSTAAAAAAGADKEATGLVGLMRALRSDSSMSGGGGGGAGGGAVEIARLPSIPGVSPIYLVLGPRALVQFSFNKDLGMLEGLRPMLEPIAPVGLFDDIQTPRRVQRMARAVNSDRLPAFARVVSSEAKRFFDGLPAKGELDLFAFTYDIVTEMIVSAVFGGDLVGADLARFVHLTRETDPQEMLMDPMNLLGMVLPAAIWSRTARRRTLDRYYDELKEMVTRLVQARVAQGLGKRADFFEYIIECMTDETTGELDLLETTIIMTQLVAAATTNTFATASWTLAHLLLRQDDMARVKAEIAEGRRAAGLETKSGEPPAVNVEFLDSLVYLEACLRETIRVRSAGIAFRCTTADTNVVGYDIPKGSFLILPHEYAHSVPEAFPDKLEYRPERHLVTDTASGRPAVDMATARVGKLLVFGAGRHPCVGMKVATHIIKILFVALTDRLDDLRLDGSLDTATFQYIGVARPAKPMILHYTKRVL